MLDSRWFIAGFTALAISAPLAWSAPLVDGTVGAGEYATGVPDTYVSGALDETLMTYHGSGLDIETMYFTTDGSARYVGLIVDPTDDGQDHGFDPNGSPASYTGQTAFNLSFYTTQPDLSGASTSVPACYLNLIVSDGGVEQAELVEWDDANTQWRRTNLIYGLVLNGSVPTFDPTIPLKYAVQCGEALEISLSEDLFLHDAGDAEFFVAQLDDLGGGDDDQMTGHLPEPATLAILALGAAGVLRRRRRG